MTINKEKTKELHKEKINQLIMKMMECDHQYYLAKKEFDDYINDHSTIRFEVNPKEESE